VCLATISVDGSTLNMRAAPGGNWLATIPDGQSVRVYSVTYLDNGQEWAYALYRTDTVDVAGYVASYYYAAGVWQEWLVFEDTEACDLVRWPEPDYPPMSFGWHNVVPELNPGNLEAGLHTLNNGGIKPALFNVETPTYLSLVRSMGGYAALRVKRNDGHIQDCPTGQGEPEAAAREIWQRTRAYFWTYANPTAGIYIAVDNECKVFWNDLNWTDRYLSETLRLFGAEGFRMAIMNTFAGDWTADRVNGLPATWEACREYGCILGLHAYGALPGKRVSYALDTITEPWLNIYGGQHEDVRQWLIDANPLNADILIWYTEVGTSTGGEKFDPTDCPEWFHKVRDSGVGVVAMS
jgi:hypothetical protein